MLRIKVGNAVWWSLMGLTAAGTSGLYALLRGSPEPRIRAVLFGLGCLTMVLYVVQRLFMFRDGDFLREYGSRWQDLLVQFLPLHLCYAGLILTLIGLWFDVEPLLAFSFYVGALGATFAMVAPDGYNQNKSVLQPHILLFYALHGMLICVYVNIGLLGLFDFGYAAGFKAVMLTLALAAVIHVVNVVGHRLGLNAMNYFYTMDPGGSGLLELLWKWIPCRFFYIVLPAAPAFTAWTVLLNLIYRLLV